MQTSLDAFLDGRFTLEQPRQGPRAGIDALLLAAMVPCGADEEGRVLDAGCGCAPITLSIATRFSRIHVVGVERQSEIADLARRNVAHNKMNERVSIIEADLTRPLSEIGEPGLNPQSFSHVVANPPFYRTDQSRSCKSDNKSAAHRLQEGELEEWIRFLTAMAAPKASLSLIHRPDALPELLALLKGRFGALKIVPVFSSADHAAIRILVQGNKGHRGPMSLLPGFVLRNKEGRYHSNVEDVLRHGKALRF
jgi:tRNA1(Val) A37 N6-methylase TrmN6